MRSFAQPRLLVLAVLLEACGGSVMPLAGGPAARIPPSDIAATVLLIGDAGEPAADSEPVLVAAAREIGDAGGRTTVIFLGDNIYPGGMPDSLATNLAESERRIDAQIALVTANGASGIFVPGNHDWANGGQDGWAAVQREEAYVRRAAGDHVLFLPGGGCPGPSVVDVGTQLRLVLLDTQWWLHNGPRPEPPESRCPASTTGEVMDSLRRALGRAAPRQVMVLAHHPLVSGGPHSGHFDWKDHIFPLRNLVHWLWLPLPVIGSVYPLVRGSGVSPQDMTNSRNRAMRREIEHVLAEHKPLVYASGHDHNLQVFRGQNAQFLLVSGGGFYGRPYPVSRKGSTLFATAAKGFMRLDVLNNHRVRLGVIAVHGAGLVTEEYSAWLQ